MARGNLIEWHRLLVDPEVAGAKPERIDTPEGVRTSYLVIGPDAVSGSSHYLGVRLAPDLKPMQVAYLLRTHAPWFGLIAWEERRGPGRLALMGEESAVQDNAAVALGQLCCGLLPTPDRFQALMRDRRLVRASKDVRELVGKANSAVLRWANSPGIVKGRPAVLEEVFGGPRSNPELDTTAQREKPRRA